MLLLAGILTAAENEKPPQQDPLTPLSVEEILGLQVTSVGRKAQQLANAPAAVYVITQEDIRRSGANSIPDLLRIVPGLVVARISGNAWAISARGGTRQFANKMQVMVDGRPVYNRLFSGVFWDTLDLMLEDIDRIEVIRGAGAVMWGSNAVNGVIHIITKSTKDTLGSLLTLGTGNEDVAFSAFRFGGKRGERLSYRLWGKQNFRAFYAPGSSLVRQKTLVSQGESRLVSDGFADDQDASALRSGFRLDWQKSAQDSLELSGMLYRNQNNMEAWFFEPGASANRFSTNEVTPGGNLLARWTHLSSKAAETTYQFWVDRSIRNSQLYEIRLDAVDADVQHRRKISENNELHLGAGYRLTGDSLIGNKTFRFAPSSRTDSLSNVMLRNEHQWLQSRLTLSAGIRAEHNAYTGFEWQPSIRLLFTPTKSQSLWASYSRAVRTPSRAEHDSDSVPLARTTIESIPVLLDFTGNRQMNAERIKEWALGYRYQRRQRWSLDVSAFRNSLTSLASVEPGRLELKPGPELRLRQLLFTGNGRVGLFQGIEVAGSGTITQNWKVHGSYSFLAQRTDVASGSRDIYGPLTREEPRSQFKFRSLYNLSRQWQFDTSLYRVASIPVQEIPSRLRIDTRLGWRPNRKHDLSIVAQDLLDQRQLEFPSELFVYAVPVRRTILLRWTVRF